MTHFLQRAGTGLLVSCALASLPAAAPQRVRPVLTQALPHLQGGRLQATMLEVNYGPGESSSAHSHPCPVIGYVVQGAIRTQVQGEPEAIFKAGEGFYEAPNGVHAISANASKTAPAKFVAYFLCDHDTPLSVDVPHAQTAPAPYPPDLRTAHVSKRAPVSHASSIKRPTATRPPVPTPSHSPEATQ
ncbi:MAG: cupin domain-containing protein [Acidobacteria bacterium]|nr:cupin domain-containing protein [Acidobacteriota bacterium]